MSLMDTCLKEFGASMTFDLANNNDASRRYRSDSRDIACYTMYTGLYCQARTFGVQAVGLGQRIFNEEFIA